MNSELVTTPPQRVFLSIGSNLGNPQRNCQRGIEMLRADETMKIISCSPFYRTEPIDFRDQGWFVNAVLLIQTTLAPLELLEKTQRIEERMGRKEGGPRFGPRVLDLDIIFYGDLTMESLRLVIPHPRMHKRRFVLQPICDIDPLVVHPVLGHTMQELLNQVLTDGQEIEPCSSDC